ncbi:hypothetical protein E1B28_007804 [Marasmius oreades]|uniref:Uncharacterized protein n=1 Tax=Marasmius oreades TaxID=181124 RepID=A0A9P7S2M6_9AGAR|nr:uncharacterized protein E1B28_007804 [Marasmius oreades]KAG7094197.1 hypothetical protein E1B28_007804 [Marasmius oreades]
MAASSSTARQTFDLLNNVREISPEDEIFKFYREEQKKVIDAALWKDDPHYFKQCKISAVALIKMVIHAHSGVPYEIMNDARESYRHDHGHHGFVRITGARNRDACKCRERGSRVHGAVYHGKREGGKARKCDWMVSFSSRIWMLVVWYRCQHGTEQSEVPRPIRRSRKSFDIPPEE